MTGRKCTRCQETKLAGDFYFTTRGSPANQCKACVIQRARERAAPAAAARTQAKREVVDALRSRGAKVCTKCQEEKPLDEFHPAQRGLLGLRSDCKACNSKKTLRWVAENPDKAKDLAARRPKTGHHYRLARRRTPLWACKERIKAVYAQARASGGEVDHIYPLRGKTVSGLHTDANLMAVSRGYNLRKGRRMPGFLTSELWVTSGSQVFHG